MTIKNLIVGIIIGVALTAGILLAMSVFSVAPKQPATATVLPSKSAVPVFSALNQDGDAIDQDVFKGQWDLVFFGFTNCPDTCPLTLQVLRGARKKLHEAGHSPLPRIVLVSVDPERDTPKKMSAYIDNFGDDNLGITGDLEQIETLASGLYVYFNKMHSDGDHYVVDHSASVLVIGPDGRVHAIFSAPHKIENFVNDLPLLMRS